MGGGGGGRRESLGPEGFWEGAYEGAGGIFRCRTEARAVQIDLCLPPRLD